MGPVELIAWPWRDDADNGVVPSYTDNGALRTVGIWWDHVLSSPLSASSRDNTSSQELREHYTYIHNPFFSTDAPQIEHGILIDQYCAIVPCGLTVRNDLPYVNPVPLDWFTDALGHHLAGPARVALVEDTILGFDGITIRAAQDLGAWLSEDLQNMIVEGQSVFVTPVESGRVARRLGNTTHGVAFPAAWDASAIVEPIVPENGQLALASELGSLPAPSGTIPSARNHPQALLTLSDRALLLLGGDWQADASLTATGQIFKYDLDTGIWTELFQDAGVKPMAVQAAAYDFDVGQLLAIDFGLIHAGWETTPLVEAPVGPPRTQQGPGDIPIMRWLRFQVRAGHADVFRTCVRDPAVDHIGLVALEGDKTIYVEFRGAAWTAWLANLRGADPVFLGRVEGSGVWHSHPFLTDDGVVLPHAIDGLYAVEVLTEASFGEGPEPTCELQ